MFFVIVGVELQMICPGVGPQDMDLIQYTDQERAESSLECGKSPMNSEAGGRETSKGQNSNV
jgi:hypothetical protein